MKIKINFNDLFENHDWNQRKHLIHIWNITLVKENHLNNIQLTGILRRNSADHMKAAIKNGNQIQNWKNTKIDTREKRITFVHMRNAKNHFYFPTIWKSIYPVKSIIEVTTMNHEGFWVIRLVVKTTCILTFLHSEFEVYAKNTLQILSCFGCTLIRCTKNIVILYEERNVLNVIIYSKIIWFWRIIMKTCIW